MDISKRTYERNDIETIVDNNGTLWLNEKHTEEGVDHKQLREITIKYHSNHRKHRYELAEQPRKQCNTIFMNEKLPVTVFMDCRTTLTHKFGTRLGFKHMIIILTSPFPNKKYKQNIEIQYNVLSYRTGLYFHYYKFSIKIGENGHSDRSIDYKVKRQKVIEEEIY